LLLGGRAPAGSGLSEVVRDPVRIVEPDRAEAEAAQLAQRLVDRDAPLLRELVDRLDVRDDVLNAARAGIGRQIVAEASQAHDRRAVLERVLRRVEARILLRRKLLESDELGVERP